MLLSLPVTAVWLGSPASGGGSVRLASGTVRVCFTRLSSSMIQWLLRSPSYDEWQESPRANEIAQCLLRPSSRLAHYVSCQLKKKPHGWPKPFNVSGKRNTFHPFMHCKVTDKGNKELKTISNLPQLVELLTVTLFALVSLCLQSLGHPASNALLATCPLVYCKDPCIQIYNLGSIS